MLLVKGCLRLINKKDITMLKEVTMASRMMKSTFIKIRCSAQDLCQEVKAIFDKEFELIKLYSDKHVPPNGLICNIAKVVLYIALYLFLPCMLALGGLSILNSLTDIYFAGFTLEAFPSILFVVYLLWARFNILNKAMGMMLWIEK